MNQVVPARERTDIDRLRDQMNSMAPEFKTALPDHIPPERFQRVAMTAINRNPDLQRADRKSLFEACMLAAQDGLLPDGRQAALVVFNTKVTREGKEVWVQQVQYMPMVAGIRMKVYQSGEIKGLTARVAYENDEFDYAFGLNEFLEHKPCRTNPGEIIAAYAIATFKDGTKEFDVMTVPEIEKVRAISRNGSKGPWRDWYAEMAKKTVIRRLAKSLPLSSELDDFMRRDDNFYDVDRNSHAPRNVTPPAPLRTIENRLDEFAADGETASQEPSAPPAEVTGDPEHDGAPEASPAPAVAQPADGAGDAELPESVRDAMAKGKAARASGMPREIPKVYNYKSRQPEADAFRKGWDDENARLDLEQWGTAG